jgi:pyruvate carboxylase
MGEPNDEGFREIFFQINGQTRNILVKDNSIKSSKVAHAKISGDGDVGAPLQGKLVKIMVDAGDNVVKGQPLFVIEAMKMESTINSPLTGNVQKVILNENSMVEQDDCIIVIKEAK